MKLEHSFDVAAPLERVWRALIDVEYVAPCLPGAAITGRDESGDYRGTFTIKLGPTTAAYNGVLRIGEIDEEAHRATLHARGTDKRGQGAADATIVNTVTAAGPESTHVEAVTDFTITGRLARFGRGGMMEDISNRLLGEFARCLAERLAAESEPEPAAEPEPEPAAEPEPEPAAEPAPEPEPPSAPPPPSPGPPPPAEPWISQPPAEPWISQPPLTEPLPTAESAGVAEGPAVIDEPAGVAEEAAVVEEPAPVEEATVAESPPAPEPPAPPPAPPAPRTGSIPPPSPPPPPPPPRQAAPPAAAPVKGFSLFFSVLWERIKRRVRGGRKAQ